MSTKKIMDLIPESLHQQLRDEVVEDLKNKGWNVAPSQEKKNQSELDKDIQDWAKNSENKNDWSKKI